MDWIERLKNSGLDTPLFQIGGTTVTPVTLVTFVLVVAASFWVARLSQRAVIRAFGRSGQGDAGAPGVAARLVRYTVLVVGLGIAVDSLGIDLSPLFAAGAFFAVAIGFAMQNIVANFVSGIILLTERAIKPGDILEVEGRLVRVRDMGIRATIARTLDEEDIIVPNSQLVAATVKNYTFQDSTYRLRTEVGVAYSSDMALVRKVLESAADELAWRSETYPPRILMTAFGDSSVNFEVSVWIDHPWEMRSRRSQLNEAIWWALKEADVTIAFPQVDVHFDPPVAESLATLRSVG